MHFFNHLLLVALLWTITDTAKPGERTYNNSEIICSSDEINEWDVIVTRIVSFTKTQRQFPRNKDEIQGFCRATKNDEKELTRRLKDCVKGVTKNFAQVLTYSLGSAVKTYCNPKNKRKQNELLSMAQCMNIGQVQEKSAVILSRYTQTLKHSAVANPVKNRIGYACCHYFKLLSSVETTLLNYCTEKQTKSITDFIRNIIQSLIDVACMDFTDSSDTCDHLPPPPKGTFASLLPNSTSFIVPLVELFANLKD